MTLARNSFLRFVLLLLLTLGFSPALASPQDAAPPSQPVLLTLLGTTDLHGNLAPVDYFANHSANRGLAKIATLVRQVRAEQPNLLLLDSGDTIQGTPLAYYFARKQPNQLNPTIAVMNALQYDAMALGNHEFNFGLDNLWRAKREAKFPVLAANVQQQYPPDSNSFFRPYLIKSVAGVRVAIVGFVTPGIPRWELPANYQGYQFEPIVDAARRVIPEVRKQADLVVVIAHSGLEKDPDTGRPFDSTQLPGENAIYALASEVPGIDVILFGHSHRELPERIINGVLLVQARNWGQSLARADVSLSRQPSGSWQVVSKRSTTLPVTDSVPPDPQILALAKPYDDATQKYLDTPVATCAVALDGLTARYEDSPLVDLIHKVQMEYGNAEVSLATMLFAGAKIPAGQVTVRQIAALYIYDNTLFTVEMTGAQLKEALEHAASFFSAWPLPAGESPRLPGYNADNASGVNYEIDVRQPVGSRIRNLSRNGAPLDPAARLRVAVNNYRYAGGGRYTVLQGLPVVYRSPQEIRDLIIEYVQRTGSITTTADNNWRIQPPEALAAILNEAQRLQEGPASRSAAH